LGGVPPVCPPYIGFFGSKRGGDPLNKVFVKKILEKFLGKFPLLNGKGLFFKNDLIYFTRE
jgi:hypothetical protein